MALEDVHEEVPRPPSVGRRSQALGPWQRNAAFVKVKAHGYTLNHPSATAAVPNVEILHAQRGKNLQKCPLCAGVLPFHQGAASLGCQSALGSDLFNLLFLLFVVLVLGRLLGAARAPRRRATLRGQELQILGTKRPLLAGVEVHDPAV